MNPFEAYRVALTNPNKQFVPNYSKFLKAFRNFLFNFIHKEKEFIYETLKSNPEKNTKQFILLLHLSTELDGIELPYATIIKELINKTSTLDEFRAKFMNKVHVTIKEILREREIGSTKIFDLKKMRHTPFVKYSAEILKIRKDEYEEAKVFRYFYEGITSYSITNIIKTYYGSQFFEFLDFDINKNINQENINKLYNYGAKLNLKLNVIDEEP
jgi:hypothetical protein